MTASADSKARALRYLAGFAVMMCSPAAMKFAMLQTDDLSLRMIVVPFFMALSGFGVALMWSANDEGSLGSGGVTSLGLSGPPRDSVEPPH
jgi:hypothetical protein